MSSAAVIAGMTATVVATVALAGYSSRVARTTGDFYVACPLGAGLVERRRHLRGVPVGRVVPGGRRPDHGRWRGRRVVPRRVRRGLRAAAALVSAPLRRSGAYTLPDFCEARLRSSTVRLAASVLVVVIGWLYVVPQLQGAGRALQTILGTPVWLGGVLVVPDGPGGDRGRRDAQRHHGAGVPVLAQAGRDHPSRRCSCWPRGGSTAAPRAADSAPTFPEATSVSVGDGCSSSRWQSRWSSTPTGPSTGHPSPAGWTWPSDRTASTRAPRSPSPPEPRSPTVDHAGDDGHGMAQPLQGARVAPRVPDLRPDDRALPGHDGPAARAGPLLHQPGRAPGPADRPDRHRTGRGSSTCCPRSTGCWAGSTPPSC